MIDDGKTANWFSKEDLSTLKEDVNESEKHFIDFSEIIPKEEFERIEEIETESK